MEEKTIWKKIWHGIESVLPMTIGNFLLFVFVIYLIFIVGRSIWLNYQSNKGLDQERQKIAQLRNDVQMLELEIAYYKTQSFKEKEARAKLGYMAPGEKVLSLAFDQPEDKVADPGKKEQSLKTPNYRLWVNYFLE